MNSLTPCPKCGRCAPSNQLDGLCPSCLLATGVDGVGDALTAETITSSRDADVDLVLPEAGEFADYELLEEIARGGMGVVFRARHTGLNRIVALKMILHGQLASESDVRRFYLEAESAANLDHPGIVPIYEIGESAGCHFFSMKLIEGGSLNAHLPELRKNPRAIAKVIARVARAVHHAHVRGILHRDLKPANILMDVDGNPLVSDLGLAKRIQADSDITGTGAVVGTPAYMPPEQAAGDKEVTTAVDIYSTGAILYEALVGTPPHQEDSAVKTLVKVIDGEVSPPREVNRQVDRTLDLICMKCLQRDPIDRYPSAAQLAEDLESWLAGKPVSVRPRSLASTVGEILQANLRSAIGAALIGIAAGLVVAFFFGNGSSSSYVIQNPPSEVYRLLPGELPAGHSLVFINEQGVQLSPLASLAFITVMMMTGFVVALTTRPAPGAAALAIGSVAALMMTVTLFGTQMGFFCVSQEVHKNAFSSLELLTQASVGGKQQSEEAENQLAARFPGLDQMPQGERAETLANRIFYDAALSIPRGMAIGMLFSACICILPCTAGTTFASRLLQHRKRTLVSLLRYFEFAAVLQALTFTFLFHVLIATFDAGFTGASWSKQIVAYLGLTVVAIGIYRQKLSWRWRLLLYLLTVAGVFIL